MSVTPYQMCINNASGYIKRNKAMITQLNHEVPNPNAIDAFEFAKILSVCFCKAKEEIVMDIVNAGG